MGKVREEGLTFLGACGGKAPGCQATTIKVGETILIDAGSIAHQKDLLLNRIDHIFITHSHLDHICDIPFLLDRLFTLRHHSVHLYALPTTLQAIKDHLFVSQMWADYTTISINTRKDPVVQLHPLSYAKSVMVDGYEITPFENNHIDGSCAFLVAKGKKALFLSSDTYLCPTLNRIIEEDRRIHAIIFEVSFSNRYEAVAQASKHLTPSLLEKQLNDLKREDIALYINHAKPSCKKEIAAELHESALSHRFATSLLEDGDHITFDGRLIPNMEGMHHQPDRWKRLVDIATILSAQTESYTLFDKIVSAAREFTRADGGTLYLVDEKSDALRFVILQNDTLGVHQGADPDTPITWPSVPLRDANQRPNRRNVASAVAIDGQSVNIPDVYRCHAYNFSGTKEFDAMSGYRSRSMLVVPLRDHEGEIAGVLQLINRQDAIGHVVPFSQEDERITVALASLAAMLLRNNLLVEELEKMLISFLESLMTTLDEMSAFTGGHIRRMVKISMMITDAIDRCNHPPFDHIHYDKDAKMQIYLAALMHDIGKITTPEYLINKSTKLEAVMDRIECIKYRLALLKASQQEDKKETEWVEEVIAFLDRINLGDSFLEKEELRRLEEIAKSSVVTLSGKEPLIHPDELEALRVRIGTLSQKERLKIMDHVKETQKILGRLSFPKKYRRVPEIAGAHHEKLNGSGYPEGLRGDQISLEARILAVADIFEALTAPDRPYKKPMKLSQSFKILKSMVDHEELDRSIVKLFYDEKIYLHYAQAFLQPEQIDRVEIMWEE